MRGEHGPNGEADEADARSENEATELRARLIDSIARREHPWGRASWEPRVLDAMRRVPRHKFVERASVAAAYTDEPYPIGLGQTISQPTVVALMTNALMLTGSERVLEIGTGSGYQAAVLAELVRELYTIELVEPLGLAAMARLAALNVTNVHLRIGDGYAGWPEEAPFDRILLTAAPPELPSALAEQLVEGGLLVAPVGADQQLLVRYTKHGQALAAERLGAVRFVPMVSRPPC